MENVKNTYTAEQFAADKKATETLMSEAMKILATEPAAMQYFSCIDLQYTSDPDITLRQRVKDTGANTILEINPGWAKDLGDPSILAWLFQAEAVRLALQHCTRRASLPAQTNKLSSDLIVYEDTHLLSVWREEVKKAMTVIPQYKDVADVLEPLGFKKSTDWYKEKLKAYFDSLLENNEQSDEQGDNGNGQGDTGEEQDQQDSDDKQNSESKTIGHGNRSETGDKTIDALNRHFSCNEQNARKATEEWGENTSVSAEVKRITNWLGSNPEMWGNFPGGLQEAIRKANKPKFDPSKVTRQFAATIKDVAKMRKRNKTNRRHPELAGLRHKTKCSMGFFTDVSGSMSDEDVAMGMAWMEKFIKHAELYYAFWDASCGPITRIKHTNKDNTYDVTGRGGTDPRCIIKRLEDDKVKLGGIVVFTDNGFDWPEPPKKWKRKIFIIGTRNCDEPPTWCKHFLNVKDIDKYLKEHA